MSSVEDQEEHQQQARPGTAAVEIAANAPALVEPVEAAAGPVRSGERERDRDGSAITVDMMTSCSVTGMRARIMSTRLVRRHE